MHFCCCAPAQSVGLRNKYDILERDAKPGNKLLLIQMNKKPTQVERGLPRGKALLKIKLFAQAFWKILLSFMCQRLGEGGWLRNAGPPGFPSPCRQCQIVFFFPEVFTWRVPTPCLRKKNPQKFKFTLGQRLCSRTCQTSGSHPGSLTCRPGF